MAKKQSKAGVVGSANNTLLILLSLTLTLIALAMYPNTMDQYSLPKTTLLYLATVGLLFAFVLKAVKEKKLVIYRSSLDLPVALFVLCAIGVLLLSEDPIVGLVGQYGRYEGLPSVICYAAIYFITIQTVRNEKNFEYLIKILAIGFIPIAIYGVIQATGLDFLTRSMYGSRVHSTFGNPIIFGEYLVMMLPLLAGLARYAKEESWRLLSWFLLVLGIINLIGTESRGAWVGILISILAAGMIRYRATRIQKKTVEASKRTSSKKPSLNRKKTLTTLVVAITILTALLIIIPGSRSVNRLASVFSVSRETITIRTETWKSSLSMIKDRPISGFGFEHMGYWFPVYETAKYARLAGKGVADRTHNDLLQVGVDAGMPAILIYFWIVFIVALKARESQRKFVYSTTLTCAIIGYATQAQTGVTSVFIGPMIWSLLAAATSIVNPGNSYKIKFKQKTNLKPIAYFAGIVCLGLEILAFLPFVADQHIFRGENKAIKAQETGTIGLIAPEYDAAISLFPYQNVYNKAAVEFYINYATELQNSVFAKTAVFIAKKGLIYNKRDYELAYYVGEANFIDYRISEDDSSLSEAEKYFKLTLKLHPYYNDAMSRLLEIAILRKDQKKAVSIAGQLVGIGVEDITAYAVLLEDAKARGDIKKANQYLSRLQALDRATVTQNNTN